MTRHWTSALFVAGMAAGACTAGCSSHDAGGSKQPNESNDLTGDIDLQLQFGGGLTINSAGMIASAGSGHISENKLTISRSRENSGTSAGFTSIESLNRSFI